MMPLQRLLIIILALSIVAFTVELIRRRKLKEQYALLWILTGLVLFSFALFPEVLYWISTILHFHYLTTMLLVTFIFLLIIVLHFSTVISQHTEHETILAQRIAILEWKLEQLSDNQSLNLHSQQEKLP